MQIAVDGVTLAYLNEYDAETQYQQYWTYNTLGEGEHVLTLTHASGTLVDIDGIWVEELLPERFTGAEYTYDGDGNLVKSEVNGVVTLVPTIRASTMKKRSGRGTMRRRVLRVFLLRLS